MNHNEDKAGLQHWDNTERNTSLKLQPFEPTPGLRGYSRRLWHRFFDQTFSMLPGGSKTILELGCGGSAYLPYFSKYYGFQVSGIDYSQSGIDLAREMCERNGVTPTLYCADFFEVPAEDLQNFDAVASFGVVEHFTDTDETVRAFSRFVRPDGLLLTVVPNMEGLTGFFQRLLSRRVFEIHEVITPERLRKSHAAAGLEVLQSNYFMFLNFGVINPDENPNILVRLIFGALRALTGLIWAVESITTELAPNRLTSPFVVCVARKAEVVPAQGI